MTVYTLFSGDSLLVIAIAALILGSALVIAPFLGLGVKRQDPALQSIMDQVNGYPGASARFREAYIADIVDAPAAPRSLTR